MSNKTLKATVKLDTAQAERRLNNIVKAINKINEAANKSGNNNQKVNNALNRAVGLTERLKQNINKTTESSGKFNSKLQKSNTLLSSMVSKMKRLASIYLGVMGARALFTTADNITSSENRLNNVNSKLLGDDPSDGYSKSTINATTEAMNKMFAASQRARTGYADMMANVSKSMVLAGDAFGNNLDNAIAFQETMAKAYSVGGASAAEQASSMYQMIQALGSGILQGDELRSVREGAPLAYKAIEEFAQGVYNTEESLKDLASQGKITSDMVVAAIANASESINSSFNASAMTWAQAWTHIKNVAVDAIRPIQDTMNEFLSSDAAQVLLAGIEAAIRFLGAAINWVLSLLSSAITWFVDNWYWIQWIVYAGIILIIGALAKMAAQAIITATTMFVGWLLSLSPIAWIILGIGAIIAILAYLGITVQQVVGFIVGIVCAAVTFLGTTIYDAIAFVVNLIIGIGYTIEAVCHNIKVWWSNMVDSITAKFLNGIANMIEGCDWLISALNKIGEFLDIGTINVSGVTSKLRSAADSRTSSMGTYKSVDDAFKKGFSTLPIVNVFDATSKAYNQGYSWGSDAVNWIGGKLSNLTNKFTGKYGSESIGALDPTVALNTSAPDLGNIAKGTGDTADNTGKIADSMELTQEDLEYLRKLAQLEWKKEYTSNQININMTNNNNVNSDSDLDGIVTKLTEKLYEELSTTASGVYA